MKNRNLQQLKSDIISNSKRGYPIIIAGVVYWLAMSAMPLFFEKKTAALIYVLACGTIFPMGILFAKMLKIDFLSKENPLGVLGGLAGGFQMVFFPLIIYAYQTNIEWVPIFIAIFGGAHFWIYNWIYNSKAYLFLTFAMLGLGYFFFFVPNDAVFSIFPLIMASVYAATVIWLLFENKKDMNITIEQKIPLE